jgi:hypothetical protein
MRTLQYLLVLGSLLVPAAVYAGDPGLMRLGLSEGGVQAQIQDTTDWTDAPVNVPLDEGDRLWVPDGGKAEVQIRGGVFARADGNTALDILSANNDAAQFYLDRGHAYINNRRGGIRTVQVDTPLSSVRSYDNSVIMLDVSEDGVTEVSVLKGHATVESRAGAMRVSAGNTLTVRGDQDAELAPIGSPDEWERWNTDRDRKVTTWGESARYLPDELHEYSADFDNNGSWDFVSEYGYVWAPTVSVVEWAPYTQGRWVWIRGNYVWIAYDPWGWAPYHYGRWVFVASRGWCWVPPIPGAVYWGPGYVGWTVTPTTVAWVPLAPGETYYGHGHFGPGSVNITTANVNTVVVNRTYMNARHDHAVTVVARDSFGTGSRVPVRDAGNPFLDTKRHRERDIALTPPPDRPRRPIVLVPPETRDQARQRPPEHGQVKREFPEKRHETPPLRPGLQTEQKRETPPAVQPRTEQQPPERVRTNRPETLKHERRLVKEQDASVFRQQAPASLPVKRSNEPRVIIRTPSQQQAGEQKDRKEPHAIIRTPPKQPVEQNTRIDHGEKREGR